MFEIDNSSKESIIRSIERIAKDLILNKAISVNGYLFSFVDIEFYYRHENHPDKYTLDHFRPKGELELHQFGIDISLGRIGEDGYGGILICGLYDKVKDQFIPKPQVIKELFNQIKMGANQLMLVEHKSPFGKVFKSRRLKLGNTRNLPDKQNFVNSLYKYIAKDEGILKKYKGKEAILRSSNLTEKDIEKLIKYKLKK